MRILISIILTALYFSSVFVASPALAAPLKNYDRGHFSVDAGGTIPTNLSFSDYMHPKKATSLYFGGYAGLGGNTALNYRMNQYRTSGSEKITANQLNLMYKFLPQVAVYAGYLNTRTDVNDISGTSNSGQVGLQARVDIPLLFTVWGQAGIGKKMNSWEIGLTKALFNNIDLNVSYYDSVFKNLSQGGEAKARGINAGVSVTF